MLVKKLVAASLMTAAFGASAAEVTLEEMKAAFVKQQQEIAALKKQVANSESVHSEAIQKYIKDEVAASKPASLINLSSHVEKLKWKGDLRLRWENTEFGDGHAKAGKTQDRIRQRVRFGFEYQTNEGWDIGLGLATGDAGGRSTNDTHNEDSEWATGDIRLDYAFVKYDFDNGVTLTAGQHKNPYLNSKILFDSDLRPVGVTAQYEADSFYATTGAYEVSNYDKDDEDAARMFAGQVGMEVGMFDIAAGLYHFNTSTAESNGMTNDSEFTIAQLYAGLSGKTDSFKYKAYGEVFTNLAADGASQSGAVAGDTDQDMGYVFGAEVGVSAWKFGYQYVYVEADAMFEELTDSDFADPVNGDDVNASANIVKVGYALSKNSSVGAKYIMAEQIEGDDDGGQTLQLDFKYKF